MSAAVDHWQRAAVRWRKCLPAAVLVLLACTVLLRPRPLAAKPPEVQPAPPTPPWAEIRVTDAATGQGVPLVELETVNGLTFVTDNAGRIAFQEPGLMGQQIYFDIHSHGYEHAADGFGFTGVRITPQPGQTSEIKLTRRNLAERLCRLTGEGRYRDSLLLGYKSPLAGPLNPGGVAGQDSIQAAIYRQQIYWFWGDTQRMDYPLGLFRMAGATTPLVGPQDPASDPRHGIAYQYFVDDHGRARAMMPLPERRDGVIWISAVFTVPDEQGTEKLVGHYSRRKSLEEEYEQGLAVFNDEREIFEPVLQLPLDETWRRPAGHPIRYEAEGRTWLLFGSPTPNVRVPATLRDVLDTRRYEAFTVADAASNVTADGSGLQPAMLPDHQVHWRWQNELPPTDSAQEHAWISSGKLPPDQARFCPAGAAAPEERIVLHRGTVRWNAFRKCWVLIAGQIGGKPSYLGEVWYAEGPSPTGPFRQAVKIVSHDRQSFYNVCHHDFLDRAGGRQIYFEGTYTHTFSGNPRRTPRYDYNQILYCLDLANPALRPAQHLPAE